jgi:hypothetical protein
VLDIEVGLRYNVTPPFGNFDEKNPPSGFEHNQNHNRRTRTTTNRQSAEGNKYKERRKLPLQLAKEDTMGACVSSNSEDGDSKKRSQMIDKKLEEDSKRLRRECKILLLGMWMK